MTKLNEFAFAEDYSVVRTLSNSINFNTSSFSLDAPALNTSRTPFYAIITHSNNRGLTSDDPSDYETVLVNNVTGSTVTSCIRGYFGSGAQPWPAGSLFLNVYTTSDFNNFANNVAGMNGLKNYIINGDFSVYQRGWAFNAGVNAGLYTADRWSVHTNATGNTCAVTIAYRNTGSPYMNFKDRTYALSQMLEFDLNIGWYASAFQVFKQRIEDVGRLAGKQMTLSFVTQSDVSREISVEIIQDSEAGMVETFIKKFDIPEGNEYHSVTFDVPTVASPTNARGSTHFQFWLSAGSSYNSRNGSLFHQPNGIVRFGNIQLEEGPVATRFEIIPKQRMLELCQRYYWNTYNIGLAPGYNASIDPSGLLDWRAWGNTIDRAPHYISFPVNMRRAPTITYWSVYGEQNKITNGSQGVAPIDALAWRNGRTSMIIIPANNSDVNTNDRFYAHLEADAEF